MQQRWVYGLNCKLHPIGFSKYEFNNKLLSGVTLLRVTLSVTWYLYIYTCTYIWLGSNYTWSNFQQCYTTQYF